MFTVDWLRTAIFVYKYKTTYVNTVEPLYKGHLRTIIVHNVEVSSSRRLNIHQLYWDKKTCPLYRGLYCVLSVECPLYIYRRFHCTCVYYLKC